MFFREGKSRTDTSKVILHIFAYTCIYLKHDDGHYTKSLTPIKEFKESLKLLAPMDRIRELETERAAKRTLCNSNKREKRLRQKISTMKQVLAEHLGVNDELKEKLSKFEGK